LSLEQTEFKGVISESRVEKKGSKRRCVRERRTAGGKGGGKEGRKLGEGREKDERGERWRGRKKEGDRGRKKRGEA